MIVTNQRKWVVVFVVLLFIIITFVHLEIRMTESYLVSSAQKTYLANRNSMRGAIVTLARKEQDIYQYQALIKRNKSIRKYLFTCCNMDVIIFHEGDLNLKTQTYISSHTPDMPILFKNVSDVFSQYKRVNNTECPSSLDTLKFHAGYHSMCYFWFIGFRSYLNEYDWMFRIDADCQMQSESRQIIPRPPDIHFASPHWQDLSADVSDLIARDKPDGFVVKGIKRMVNSYASSTNISGFPIHTWHAPYTNVMYLNLTWLRGNDVIRRFMALVDRSQCIYSNRWGDLPLWGAAIALSQEPQSRLPLSYYHGSHKLVIYADGGTKMTEISNHLTPLRKWIEFLRFHLASFIAIIF